MGGEYRTTYNGVENTSEELFYLPDDDIRHPRRDFIRDIPYHSDWNYLMPVVQKCLKQQGENRWIVSFDSALLSCDLNELWKVVVKYITSIK